jgi:hypothetical protein
VGLHVVTDGGLGSEGEKLEAVSGTRDAEDVWGFMEAEKLKWLWC